MDFSAKNAENGPEISHSGRFSSERAEKTVRKVSFFVVLVALTAFTSAVYADQADVGPVIGVATVTVLEQECSGPGVCDYHAFLTQKLVLNGSTFTRETKCTGFQGATDAYNSPCGPSQWLGNCTKTAVSYSSRSALAKKMVSLGLWSSEKAADFLLTPTKGLKSGTINGTVYFCNNDHTGNCKSVSGHFDPLGRVLMDSISSTGGCQY